MAACRAISETKSRSATVSLSLPACNECNSACRARCKQKSVGGAKQTPQTAQCVRELSPAAQAPSSPGASCTRRSRRSKSAAKPTLPVRDRKAVNTTLQYAARIDHVPTPRPPRYGDRELEPAPRHLACEGHSEHTTRRTSSRTLRTCMRLPVSSHTARIGNSTFSINSPVARRKAANGSPCHQQHAHGSVHAQCPTQATRSHLVSIRHRGSGHVVGCLTSWQHRASLHHPPSIHAAQQICKAGHRVVGLRGSVIDACGRCFKADMNLVLQASCLRRRLLEDKQVVSQPRVRCHLRCYNIPKRRVRLEGLANSGRGQQVVASIGCAG